MLSQTYSRHLMDMTLADSPWLNHFLPNDIETHTNPRWRAPLATTYIQARLFITRPTCNTFSNHSIFWPRVMKINNREEKHSCIYHCGFSSKKYYFYYLQNPELIQHYFQTKLINPNVLKIFYKWTNFRTYCFRHIYLIINTHTLLILPIYW